jgi:glycine cleavage system transcriptional repressor
MKTYFVITVTCPDRPGIVEKITEVMVAHAANWEESRLARLGGEFAGMVLVSVVAERADALATALLGLADGQMTVALKVTQPPGDAPSGHHTWRLELTGADHEGIVHTVAAYLARQGINVDELETDVTAAPITASPLFRMTARIQVPQHLAFEDLRANLGRIAEDLGVDIDIAPGD